MITELKARGIIHQVTGNVTGQFTAQVSPLSHSAPAITITEHLESASRTLYAGFDPSANSLHAGNLFSIVTLKRFLNAGHRVIALVGGATGRIGDPSGKALERTLMSEEQIQKNLDGIKGVLKRILGNDIQILDNYEWFRGFQYLDFLRTVGKHFTVNYMVAKESVRARLEDRDQGISYTEFSYMLLQAYDFYYLNKHFGCTLQIGGADQWGNITAGTELIRRMAFAENGGSSISESQDTDTSANDPHVFGLTTPLLTKSDGTKFGKSESGAVWLSEDKTSVYDFYQFWLRVADADVIHFLKVLTFVSLEEIKILEEKLKAEPEKREAQKRLAQEITRFVHGEEALLKVESVSGSLFNLGSNLESLSLSELTELFANTPKTLIDRAELKEHPILDILLRVGLSSSKGEAKKDIQGGGIYLNQAKVSDIQLKLSESYFLANRFILLRKGKKNFHVVEINE